METIKKYKQNRKLYSTTLSKYVTLSYVLDLVKTNQKFQVIDSKTKEDLTNLTIKQTLTVMEVPTTDLTALIRSL